MKRHTKLFEEFSADHEKQHWVVFHQGDAMIYGIFDDEDDARETYTSSRIDANRWDDEEEDDQITMERLDASNEGEMRKLFHCARNWNQPHIAVTLMVISPDPSKLFDTPEETYDFFMGKKGFSRRVMDLLPPDVMDRLPTGLRDRIKRSSKSEKLFGI